MLTHPPIPGPSLLKALFPLLSNLKQDDIWLSLEYPLELMQKYGSLCRFPFARHTYLVSGAKEMEAILKTQAHNFSKDNFIYRRLAQLFGPSLLVSEGSAWKHQRKISQPAFQMSMIKDYVGPINELTQELVAKLKRNPRQKIEMVSLMNTLTLRIIFKLTTGESVSKKILKKLGRAIYFSNYYLTHTLFVSPWKPSLSNIRFYYLNYQANRIFLSFIRKHQPAQAHSESKPDLLQRLRSARTEDQTRPLSESEILYEFKTLILTGHETTAIGLSWLWYLLGKYPHYREQLEAELEQVLGGRTPTLEDLPKLEFLRAVVYETFRLYPPIWSVFRQNKTADVIGGYSIPENSLFILNFFALHRNPDYWQNPNEFYPPRFLGKHPEPFSYLPFSSGPRICIAHHFAMTETLLIAAILAQNLRFENLANTPVFPEPCISLRPKGSLKMTVVPRQN